MATDERQRDEDHGFMLAEIVMHIFKAGTGQFLGDVKMEKYYYFSSRKADAPRLLSHFSEKLQNCGYDNFPLGNSLTGEKRWNASFESTDFGCNGRFYLWSKDDEENSVENFRKLDTFFQAFIQSEVNIGNIWARGFVKQKGDDKEISRDVTKDDVKQKSTASVKTNMAEMPEKHWEYFEDKEASDKVFAFLTFEENLDTLEGFFMMGAKNGKRYSVEMAMLRKVKTFPDGAKGREKFRKEWEKYLQQASDEERDKYQERRERILNGK